VAAAEDGGAAIFAFVVGRRVANFITREHTSPRALRLHVL
jgi:hypothetical protein